MTTTIKFSPKNLFLDMDSLQVNWDWPYTFWGIIIYYSTSYSESVWILLITENIVAK